MSMYLFMAAPATIMTARVNQGAFTYPIHTVTMDAPSGWDDVYSEMTILFGTSAGDDDLGRQRVRVSPSSGTEIKIGLSSQGSRDGEVDLQDDAYITVLDDFRAWAQIPDIDPAADPPAIYKDAELGDGVYVEDPPPIANCGRPAIGTTDGPAGDLRVWLPHETNSSIAVADGAVLSTYTWTLPAAATLISTESPGGASVYDTNKVDAQRIEVDVTAGWHWFRQTVTDDNGLNHNSWVWVYAYESGGTGEGMRIEEFEITRRIQTPQGQKLSVIVNEAIDKGTYPDGTMVALWDGEPADGEDRSNVPFWGWHQGNPETIASQRTGIVKGVTLECLDIAGRLSILPGFPFTVGNDDSAVSGWSHIGPNANWFRLMAYVLNWHSNAFIVADWKPDKTDIDDYPFVIRTCAAGNLFDQMNKQANALVPDYHFTCTRGGQLLTTVDPMIQTSGNRTGTVQTTLDETDWTRLEYTSTHWPRFHWLREEAMYAHATTLSGFFSIAPGESPGMGEGSKPQGEQLALSQSDLNDACGQRYGRLNADYSTFRITLADGDDRDIDPALLTWVQLTIDSDYAAQRGLTFTDAKGLPLAVEWTYNFARTGVSKEVTITWEKETTGIPGVTYTPPSL